MKSFEKEEKIKGRLRDILRDLFRFLENTYPLHNSEGAFFLPAFSQHGSLKPFFNEFKLLDLHTNQHFLGLNLLPFKFNVDIILFFYF